MIHDPALRLGGRRLPACAPWNELVIYELHIGTFNDKAEDGAARHLQTAIELAWDLGELGVNAIESCRSASSPGPVVGLQPRRSSRSSRPTAGPRRSRLRQGVPRAGDRGDPGRGLQPLRPKTSTSGGSTAGGRTSTGGIYFFNDWPGRDALGRQPARLRPRRSPPVHRRQRPDVAGRISRSTACGSTARCSSARVDLLGRPGRSRTAGACSSGSTRGRAGVPRPDH